MLLGHYVSTWCVSGALSDAGIMVQIRGRSIILVEDEELLRFSRNVKKNKQNQTFFFLTKSKDVLSCSKPAFIRDISTKIFWFCSKPVKIWFVKNKNKTKRS